MTLTTLDPGIGMTSRRARERLIQRLIDAGIDSSEVLRVMRTLPRHLFVDEALASRAYEDLALPIGHGQTLSQPYTVARMTQALLEHGTPDTVLEIGTGSGFQTAVLASLVRRVYTVERVGDLFERAQERLDALKIRNVRYRHGDGAQGWPEYAPYQAIILTAAPRGIPRALAEQLAPGGLMVLPIGEGPRQHLVRLVRLARGGFGHEILEPASFVPLLAGVA
ncbi:protein-L-isoaspartate(D-aspartate) O-methyltransferase [Thermochromatium tepidum]|uniref:Protein-L-isoaspartate O-methyltransferase n=1 Tax=Thermochromatium tepidum ATCC 43061 TaxID=316276 RepID=A0A6I6EE77_THETI|nr:protein-L-isoaspartate(D-aspartate) O-methyltransferase [Thermochromatium tepidum]QGU33576.1 protein-L-isoaspartate(D-aspartate) O-methyltransferase [Thermochromatium tepidum ATCC 43061]